MKSHWKETTLLSFVFIKRDDGYLLEKQIYWVYHKSEKYNFKNVRLAK